MTLPLSPLTAIAVGPPPSGQQAEATEGFAALLDTALAITPPEHSSGSGFDAAPDPPEVQAAVPSDPGLPDAALVAIPIPPPGLPGFVPPPSRAVGAGAERAEAGAEDASAEPAPAPPAGPSSVSDPARTPEPLHELPMAIAPGLRPLPAEANTQDEGEGSAEARRAAWAQTPHSAQKTAGEEPRHAAGDRPLPEGQLRAAMPQHTRVAPADEAPGAKTAATAPVPPAAAEARRFGDQTAGQEPPAVAEEGMAAGRHVSQPPLASAGTEARSPAPGPGTPRPLQALLIGALHMAETGPRRADAPSLSAPVAAGSVETLNAVSDETATQRSLPASRVLRVSSAPVAEPPEQMLPGAATLPSAVPADAPGAEVEATPPSVRAPAEPQAQASSPVVQALIGNVVAVQAPPSGLAAWAQTAAPPPQPSPRPLPATPAQQLMPILVTLAGGQAGDAVSVTVTLEPVELGRVEISVRTEKDAHARVRVVAERAETLLLLLRDQASLERALAQAGVGAEGRTLSFDLAAGNDRGERNPSPHEGSDRPGSRLGGGTGSATTTETTRRRSATGALDIAV
jgi:flagellar hook-length control protein FliK